ncbi:serine/threonine-protein kinase SBK1-like [Pelobates fuscus]|uniref:serine/threonine-protein kinase SBK1-like n=1 Tax=Pelobates fuscus TaxID=191477 RepID=UPI002FE48F97
MAASGSNVELLLEAQVKALIKSRLSQSSFLMEFSLSFLHDNIIGSYGLAFETQELYVCSGALTDWGSTVADSDINTRGKAKDVLMYMDEILKSEIPHKARRKEQAEPGRKPRVETPLSIYTRMNRVPPRAWCNNIMAATIMDVTKETAKDLLKLVGETSQTMTRMSVMDHLDPIKELGKGSYGKVLLANHRRSGQLVALKMLVKEKTLADNFLLEYSICVYLGIHPHIVTTFRMAFETPSNYVFVQEVAPAGTLHSIITPKGEVGLQEDIVKRCILQLTSALEFIHYKGLVHRDIKLNNILLMDHECHCIKLADFGLTRLQGTYVPGMSWIIPYMAPELCLVADSEPILLHPSLDVWAFGVLVYVMLTGCFPWKEALPRDQQYLQFVHWQVFKDTVPIPAEWRLVTTESQHFFRLMLAIDATDRCSVSHIVEYIHWPWKADIPHKDIT